MSSWLKTNKMTVHNDRWELVDLSYEHYRPLPEKLSKRGIKDVLAAINILDKALVVAPGNLVTKALARLAISTKSRAEDSDDLKFRLAVYADELRYPADIVEEVCQKWARTEKWSPSVSDLVERCDNLVRWRRVTRDSLARMAA